ncbi:MAG TPA: hypothetical protein PKW51_02535 [Methanoregulaceae archaeon]|nr:hypothetical protein [Methanoregulaceae archaeon]
MDLERRLPGSYRSGIFTGTVLFYESSKVSACITPIPEHCPPVPECWIFNEMNHGIQPVVVPVLL